MHASVAMTDVGRARKINQDYVYASDAPVGNLPNLYIVADGMGGHRAGEIASSLAVESVIEAAQKSMDTRPALILQKAVRYANHRIFEKSCECEDYEGMGTTLVMLTVAGEEAIAANVGDSRIYEIAGDSIRQISEDHSYVAELVRKGELSPESARKHPDKNIITKALGIQGDIQPDLYFLEAAHGNKYLLCSDGLSNMVEDTELCRIISQERSLSEIGSELILQANRNGGLDNIAVVLAEVE